jgi:peptide/nickel transport system substrate-binding protein
MKEAQRLVDRSGTSGTKVVIEDACTTDCQDLQNYLVKLLVDLGYRASVKYVPLKQFVRPDNEFQMAATGWGADYPAASTFFSRLRCDAPQFPGGFCSPRIDDMIDRATKLQLEDPAAAGELWAQIDRAFVDQAPAMWVTNPIAIEFVSERVDNYQWSPQWTSELLNQLWVQ